VQIHADEKWHTRESAKAPIVVLGKMRRDAVDQVGISMVSFEEKND